MVTLTSSGAGSDRLADGSALRAPGLRGCAGPWVVAGLLLLEILALTLRFDTRTIAETGQAIGPGLGSAASRGSWIVALLEHSSVVVALAIAATAAAVLFGGRESDERLRQAGFVSPGPRIGSMLAGHFGLLGLFWWLTVRLFERGDGSSPWAPGWIALWAVSGLAVLGSLVAMAVPPRSWGRLARHGMRAVTIGLLVATTATCSGLLAQRFWMPLGHGTMQAVRGLLGTISTDLVYEPADFVVGTRSFVVRIAPACSGYEGIGLVWAFLGAYLWLCRRQLRFPRAWLLIPLGTAAILLANVLRITALIAVGTWVSPDVAAGGFHSQAVWIAFNAVALGLVALARRSRYFRGEDGPSSAAAGPSREAVYLAPLLAIVAASMICGAFSTGGLDRYYPARLAAVAVPLWLYRREYAAMRWSCSWQALAIGSLVFALWVARWPEAPAGSAVRSMRIVAGGVDWTWAWLVARIVGSVATVPLAEELAFRGFLGRRLVATDFDSVPPGRFTWTSLAVSSVAFGVLHDRWLEGTLAGLLYALAYRRRGSLGDAVAAHAVTNALLCIGAVVTGDWSLFS